LDDGGSGVRRDEIDLIVARIVRDLVLTSIEKGTAAGHKIKPAYPSALKRIQASCVPANGSLGDAACLSRELGLQLTSTHLILNFNIKERVYGEERNEIRRLLAWMRQSVNCRSPRRCSVIPADRPILDGSIKACAYAISIHLRSSFDVNESLVDMLREDVPPRPNSDPIPTIATPE
jgi:hypothetical protein